MPLLFGTAGVPLSAKERSTEAGVKRVRELQLDAMEVEFVQGVRMGEEKAQKNCSNSCGREGCPKLPRPLLD